MVMAGIRIVVVIGICIMVMLGIRVVMMVFSQQNRGIAMAGQVEIALGKRFGSGSQYHHGQHTEKNHFFQ
jgi:hypothetical protein